MVWNKTKPEKKCFRPDENHPLNQRSTRQVMLRQGWERQLVMPEGMQLQARTAALKGIGFNIPINLKKQ